MVWGVNHGECCFLAHSRRAQCQPPGGPAEGGRRPKLRLNGQYCSPALTLWAAVREGDEPNVRLLHFTGMLCK